MLKHETCERCMSKERIAKRFTYDGIEYTICDECFYECVDSSTYSNWYSNKLYAFMSVDPDEGVPW